jgi:hypothetical protein
LAEGSRGFAYIVPTDLAFLHTGADLQCHNNNTPANLSAPITAITAGCPEFETMVVGMLANPRNTVPVGELTKILWLNDGGTFNSGFRKMQGIDFTASYDFDLGDYGAWNTGINGTYYLHDYTQTLPDAPITDAFHTTITAGNLVMTGVETLPRLRYRARLGWSNGAWSVTGFADYQSHFFHTQTAPPQVNDSCQTAGGTAPGGTFPCLVTGYTNILPSWLTFDLSVGYDSGDDPANDYLKHIGVQLVVSNLLDKHSPFGYRIGTGGGNPAAMDILKPDQGRTISLILTKTW